MKNIPKELMKTDYAKAAGPFLEPPFFVTDYTLSACKNCGNHSFRTDEKGVPYRCSMCKTLRPEFQAKSGVLPW